MGYAGEYILQVVDKLRKLKGDDLAAYITQRLDQVGQQQQALSWERQLLAYWAYRYWDTFSVDFKSGYININDYFQRHAVSPEWARRLRSLLKFFLEGGLRKCPPGFDPFAVPVDKLVAAVPLIRKGRMTDDLWAALIDSTVSRKKFKQMIRETFRDRQEESPPGERVE